MKKRKLKNRNPIAKVVRTLGHRVVEDKRRELLNEDALKDALASLVSVQPMAKASPHED